MNTKSIQHEKIYYRIQLILTYTKHFSTKEKKKEVPPPVVNPIPQPPKVIEQAGTSESMEAGMITMPMWAANQVRIKKTNGQELTLDNFEELLNTDLSQIQTLALSSSISGKKLWSMYHLRIIPFNGKHSWLR